MLSQHVKDLVGPEYMMLHGVGYGPDVCVEDAKVALSAYWKMAESR